MMSSNIPTMQDFISHQNEFIEYLRDTDRKRVAVLALAIMLLSRPSPCPRLPTHVLRPRASSTEPDHVLEAFVSTTRMAKVLFGEANATCE